MSSSTTQTPRPQPPPIIGPSSTGIGKHWATQLYTAVQFLKQHQHPIRLENLALTSGVEALLSDQGLLESFRNHERVLVDDKLGLYTYKVSIDTGTNT